MHGDHHAHGEVNMNKVQIFLIVLLCLELIGFGFILSRANDGYDDTLEMTYGQRLWSDVVRAALWTPILGRVFGWW